MRLFMEIAIVAMLLILYIIELLLFMLLQMYRKQINDLEKRIDDRDNNDSNSDFVVGFRNDSKKKSAVQALR